MSNSVYNGTIGLIGLGAMGGAVGARLLANGADLTVFDISTEAVDRLVGLGAKAAADAFGVAECDVVLVSLPNDDIVTAAIIDSNLLSKLSGKILIELSTILPQTMERLEAAAIEAGVRVVDSPVSGGPNEATAGKLVMMVGASDEELAEVQPILATLGSVDHVGRVGAGKVIKIVNNMMSMGNLVIAAEAFSLGSRMGLAPEKMYEILTRSGGRSGQFEKRMPYVLADDFSARFALSLAEKDMRLALAMAHEANFPLPVAANVHQMYKYGVVNGVGDEDQVAVIKYYSKWATPDGSDK